MVNKRASGSAARLWQLPSKLGKLRSFLLLSLSLNKPGLAGNTFSTTVPSNLTQS